MAPCRVGAWLIDLAGTANKVAVTPISSQRNAVGFAPGWIPTGTLADRPVAGELNTASIILTLEDTPRRR
jgi:hypothetical protein